MDAYFKSEGFDTIGFEESVWVRPAGGKYSEDIYVSAHVDDCLLSCKSLTVMAKFKAHMLERFVGTGSRVPHACKGAGPWHSRVPVRARKGALTSGALARVPVRARTPVPVD